MIACGGISLCENIGGGPVASVVVDTDGSLQPLDTLRVCHDGFTHTGLSVPQDTIDDLRRTPVFVTCLAADDALPDVCRSCELVDVCGAAICRIASAAAGGSTTKACTAAI